MKKLTSIIYIAAAVCVSLAACKKDFLETPSPSEFTPDLVFSSVQYTEFAINGTYALLTQDQMYSARLSLNYSTNSDIEIAGADTGSYNDAGTRGLSNYVANASNNNISREWIMIYKMIERTNLCIDGIRNSAVMKTADSTTMKGYLGEAITLRALAYFELVKHWGDVPFKAEPTKYDLSNVYIPPTDRDEIYDFLLNDLQEAENYLPWVGNGNYPTVEKITKGFVKGLIARMALFRGGYSLRNRNGNYVTERGKDWQKYYELAATKCQEIMQNGKHQLNPSFVDVWRKLNSLQIDAANNENLFEVAFGLGRSGEMGYSIGIRFYTNKKYGFGNNANVVNTTAWYFYMFDQKDIRRDATIAWYTYSNGNGDIKEVFTSNPMSFNFAKWDQRFMGSNWSALNLSASGKFGYGINWSLMRFSDVLLMYAEAENALRGPTMLAKEALRKVRNRAFADADKPTLVDGYVNALNDQQSFFNAIVNERAFEFGGEGIRKYDLIRWNLLTTKIDEQRQGLINMLKGAAPWDKLPTHLFYKYQADNELLDKASVNFYQDKGTADIAGFTKVVWLQGTAASDSLNYARRAELFSSGLYKARNGFADNRHLYPIPPDVIGESQGTLTNAYGF